MDNKVPTASDARQGASADIKHEGNKIERSAFNIGQSVRTSSHPVGIQSTDDSFIPTSHIELGTEGVTVSYLRKNLGTVTLSETSVAGTTLFTLPLNATLTDSSGSTYSSRWMQYRIASLKVWFAVLAPFGTTSGGIHVASVMDPYNVLGSDTTVNLDLMHSQTKSKIIDAKTSSELELEIPQNEWKWVKGANNLRLESFGNLFCIVQQASTQGTQAQWSVGYSCTIEWKGHTLNTTTAPATARITATDVDFNSPALYGVTGESSPILGYPISNTELDLPPGSITRTSSTFTVGLTFTGPGGTTLLLPVNLGVGKILNSGDNLLITYQLEKNIQPSYILSAQQLFGSPGSFISVESFADVSALRLVPASALTGPKYITEMYTMRTSDELGEKHMKHRRLHVDFTL